MNVKTCCVSITGFLVDKTYQKYVINYIVILRDLFQKRELHIEQKADPCTITEPASALCFLYGVQAPAAFSSSLHGGASVPL